jgi:predicted HTH transcriptional regulator
VDTVSDTLVFIQTRSCGVKKKIEFKDSAWIKPGTKLNENSLEENPNIYRIASHRHYSSGRRVILKITPTANNVFAYPGNGTSHKFNLHKTIMKIDGTHEIVGTDFKPKSSKVGNEELENWISHLLDPRLDFRILEGEVDGHHMVIFEIPAAAGRPVRFKTEEYIRIGSYTKKLRDFPEKERSLWDGFGKVSFEDGIAKEDVTSDEVLTLIDYPAFFSLMQIPLPDNRAAILEKFCLERIIVKKTNDLFHVTNIGAILFAKDLSAFHRLGRKALRIIIYSGNNKVETIKERVETSGYAVGFEEGLKYINVQLPQNEELKDALRRTVRMYPQMAIRELVANALIHQDFYLSGTGPMVEIFANRMEISSPGIPLIDTLRFVDCTPRSRNEAIAAMMRRMNICEERGSGIDKVVAQVEAFQLPAPDFRTPGDNSTVAVLFAPRRFDQMDKEERIRACYWHACLMYVSGQRLTNSTLRKRMGIDDANYPQASRIIKDALDGNLIRPFTDTGSRRDAAYIPFWA